MPKPVESNPEDFATVWSYLSARRNYLFDDAARMHVLHFIEHGPSIDSFNGPMTPELKKVVDTHIEEIRQHEDCLFTTEVVDQWCESLADAINKKIKESAKTSLSS